MRSQPTGDRTDIDPRYDALKVLASMAVVVVHASAAVAMQVEPHRLAWWFSNVLNGVGHFGSALFVMVGGALLLGRPWETNPAGFMAGRLRRLLPALVFWTVFYFAWRAWLWEDLTLRTVVRDTVLGIPFYHLWFIYMMVALYMLMPGVRLIVRSPSDRRAQVAFVAACAVMTCAHSIAQALFGTGFTGFLGLVPYYLVYLAGGYLLHRDRPAVAASVLLGVATAATVAMAIGVAWLHPRFGQATFALMVSHRSPLVMLITFCVFLALVQRTPPAWLNRFTRRLSPVTLGIYLMHPLWLDLFNRFDLGLKEEGAAWVFNALVAYALSAATALLWSRIPGLRRTVC